MKLSMNNKVVKTYIPVKGYVSFGPLDGISTDAPFYSIISVYGINKLLDRLTTPIVANGCLYYCSSEGHLSKADGNRSNKRLAQVLTDIIEERHVPTADTRTFIGMIEKMDVVIDLDGNVNMKCGENTLGDCPFTIEFNEDSFKLAQPLPRKIKRTLMYATVYCIQEAYDGYEYSYLIIEHYDSDYNRNFFIVKYNADQYKLVATDVKKEHLTNKDIGEIKCLNN